MNLPHTSGLAVRKVIWKRTPRAEELDKASRLAMKSIGRGQKYITLDVVLQGRGIGSITVGSVDCMDAGALERLRLILADALGRIVSK